MACEIPLKGPPCSMLYTCWTSTKSAAAGGATAAPSPFRKLACVVDKVIVAAGEGHEATPIMLHVKVTPAAGGNTHAEIRDSILFGIQSCSYTIISRYYANAAPAATASFSRAGATPAPAPAPVPAVVVAPAPAPAPVPTGFVDLAPVSPVVAAAPVPTVVVAAAPAAVESVVPASPTVVAPVPPAVESSMTAGAADGAGHSPAAVTPAAVPMMVAPAGWRCCL